jgi:uncharacterized protein YjbJ (UPF0337 family)
VSEERTEGAFQNVAGNVQDAAGALIGDTTTQVEGKAREASKKVKDAYGDAADQARAAVAGVGRLAEEKPFAALAVIGSVAFLVGWLAHRG